MQSNIANPKPEPIELWTLEKDKIWIKPAFAREVAEFAKLKEITPECGRRFEIIFPDFVHVVSRAFLIALITDTCRNFQSFEQFREVVRVNADPFTKRNFWNAARELINRPKEKPVPWYKRLFSRTS